MSRIEDLEKRLSADPNSKIFVQLAEEYRKAGLPEDAIATCRDGLEKHPNYFSARVALGRALLETNGFEEARAEFEMVLQQVPDNLLALKFLGETFHKLGQMDEALSKYQLASTLSPEDADLAERIKQVEAAAAAAHAGASPAADPSTPPGEDSMPPTIPPPNAASRFIERQAREMGSEGVSDDVLSMQEEFEDRPVTSIFKRTAREIQDLAAMRPPAPKAAEPAKAAKPAIEAETSTPPPAPRETATIDLGGAKLKKPLSGAAPPPPAPPAPPAEDVKSVATGIDSAEPVGPSPLDAPAEAVLPEMPGASSPATTPSTEQAQPGGDAVGDDRPGLATTTLAELYVSQGHLDRAVSVYRQLVASKPDDAELQSRLEELELLATASKESERSSARSLGSSLGAGAPSTTPTTNPNVRFLEQAIRELEGWLAAIGRS